MRAIIDDIVMGNTSKNPELADKVIGTYLYRGNVENSWDKVSWTKCQSNKIDLIFSVRDVYKFLNFDDDSSYIDFEEDTVAVNEAVVRFVKSCISCQINACYIYSQTLTSYIEKLLEEIKNKDIILPITLQSECKLQDVLIGELNTMLREILIENKVLFTDAILDVVDESKNEKIKKKLKTGLTALHSLAEVE